MKIKRLKELQRYFWSYRYKCKSWCYECCTAIDFLPEEQKAMKQELKKNWFLAPPNWKGEKYCEFLTQNWKCSVYNARPMVCRAFSDLKLVLKVWEQKALTQSCTHWKTNIVTTAPFEFIKYLSEVNENGIKNENYFNIVKINHIWNSIEI